MDKSKNISDASEDEDEKVRHTLNNPFLYEEQNFIMSMGKPGGGGKGGADFE